MSKLILALLLLPFTFFLLPRPVHAQAEITSPNYIIQMPNFNTGAGIPSSTNYGVTTTIGQGAAGLFSSAGYRVKSGFQYIYTIIPFSFTIAPISINLGHLLPQTPVTTQTETLTVSSGGAGGYQVLVSENHPLQVGNTTRKIPDTTCDTTCSEAAAGVWNSNSKYGFGFNMSGSDVAPDFSGPTLFRQFADRSISETPQKIMSSIYVGTAVTSTVRYKVNISGIQAAGVYTNTIMYTAIPAY